MPEEMKETSLFDRLTQFFLQREFQFDRVPNKPFLRTGFDMKNGAHRCFATSDEERRFLAFYTYLEGNVPVEKRRPVCELLIRANFRVVFGGFEMNWSNGGVRYKTLLMLRGVQPSMDMLESLVLANVRTFDRYYPALMSVIWSETSPEEALKRLEKPACPPPAPPSAP